MHSLMALLYRLVLLKQSDMFSWHDWRRVFAPGEGSSARLFLTLMYFSIASLYADLSSVSSPLWREASCTPCWASSV